MSDKEGDLVSPLRGRPRCAFLIDTVVLVPVLFASMKVIKRRIAGKIGSTFLALVHLICCAGGFRTIESGIVHDLVLIIFWIRCAHSRGAVLFSYYKRSIRFPYFFVHFRHIFPPCLPFPGILNTLFILFIVC